MPEPPVLRVSDDDREGAAAELREHFAHGRLNAEELAERLELVYAARTAAELQAARAELPPLPPSPAAHRSELLERRSELGRELVQQTGAALAPFLVCTLVWLFSGANGGFWPAWVALVALVPLVRNGWRLYGPAPELDRVAEELAERRRRERHRPL
jgi:uncharacterized membrane protein YccC